jgi:hypothetical protein
MVIKCKKTGKDVTSEVLKMLEKGFNVRTVKSTEPGRVQTTNSK